MSHYTPDQLEIDKRRDGYATMSRDERRAYDEESRRLLEAAAAAPPPPPEGGAALLIAKTWRDGTLILARRGSEQPTHNRAAVVICTKCGYDSGDTYGTSLSAAHQNVDKHTCPPPPPEGGAALEPTLEELAADQVIGLVTGDNSRVRESTIRGSLESLKMQDSIINRANLISHIVVREWGAGPDKVEAMNLCLGIVSDAINRYGDGPRYDAIKQQARRLHEIAIMRAGHSADEALELLGLPPISGGADLDGLRAYFGVDRIGFTIDGVDVEDCGDLIPLDNDWDWYAQSVLQVVDSADEILCTARFHAHNMSDDARRVADTVFDRMLEYVTDTIRAAVALDSGQLFALKFAVDANRQLIESLISISLHGWSEYLAWSVTANLDDEAAARDWYGYDAIDADDLDDAVMMALVPISGGADVASVIRAAAREVRGVEVMSHDPVERLAYQSAQGNSESRRAIRKRRIESRRANRAYSKRRRSSGAKYTRSERRAIHAQYDLGKITADEALELLELPPISGGAGVCAYCELPHDQCFNPDRADLYLAGYAFDGDLSCLDCTPDCLTVDGATDWDNEPVGIIDGFGDAGYECADCGGWIPYQCKECGIDLFDVADELCSC